MDLNLAGFLQPLGLRHFYDAFGLKAEVSIRDSALRAFQLQDAELSSDLLVTATAAIARGWTDHDEQPVDQNAPETDLRNVPKDVISFSSSEVDSESSDEDDSSDDLSSTSTSSDASSESEPPASEVSDQQSMLEHAYDQAYDAFHVLQDGTLQGGDATLNLMEIFPSHWPLAKLTLPLKFAVQRLDRLIAGYLMELIATHHHPDQCRKSTSNFAKTLTVRVATYLAKLIASLLRPVLYHPHMIQFDDDTEPLLTSKFWVRPVYEELLHAASRFNMSTASESKRPTSNLVKVASHPRAKSQPNANLHPLHAPTTEWIGAECPDNFLNVWFPAHWAPIVIRELQDREDKYRHDHRLWFDAPSTASDSKKFVKDRADAIQSRKLHVDEASDAHEMTKWLPGQFENLRLATVLSVRRSLFALRVLGDVKHLRFAVVLSVHFLR